ncbi:MAG: BREX-1 system adenine-specific DNA-methyltransferase PglX [Verrucomicrobia bacterium]|nr:BREX-1 system adenine-specific DNA-methyltransferase PglX [Verrucomicrobiota bacterium]
MNLTQLKAYAPAARNAFIMAVTRRAGVLGIRPDRVDPVTESGDVALIGGQPFPRSIVSLRKKLVSLIEAGGFEQTMESMAYTWFDRLVALRFMELHAGYLDHGYRVLSHPEGNSLPEILQHAEHVELKGLDRDEVIRLKLDGNRDEELYRLLLLAQCNQLNHIMPSVFSKLDDVTILLLPDNLLHSDSVIRQLVNGSDPADWERVEVLGWLYQFYISEKKDAVMARKSAVPTDDIPAVTQLFTPQWIVRYLVENSLGRLWLQNRPQSKLVDHMPYYIADAANPDGESSSPNPDGIESSSPGLRGTSYPGSDATTDTNPTGVASVLAPAGRNPGGVGNDLNTDPQGSSFLATLGFEPKSLQDSKTSGGKHGGSPDDFLKITKPEDIRLCDPACGSGHILAYAFDLLYLIYEEEGYAAADIPCLILKHNLFGLEICPRAAQLAELTLVLKAREKSRRFFSEAKAVRPNILELCDVRFEEDELSEYLQAVDLDSYFENQAREWIETGDLLARNDHFDASETARDLLAVLVAEEMFMPCLDSLDLDPRFRAKLRKLLSSGKELDGLSSRENLEIIGLSSAETRDLAQSAFRTFVRSGEILKYAAKLNLGDLSKQVHLKLFHQFEESKNFGSLIQPCLTEAEIQAVRLHIQNSKSNIQNSTSLVVGASHLKVLLVLEQAEALTQRYHVVVANPPYMGRGSFGEILRVFAKDHYDNSGPDLYGMFLVRSASLARYGGMMALVTMNGWMFLGRFEKCRQWLLNSVSLTSLLHLGARAFDSLSGEVVQAAAAHFVQRRPTKELKTTFVDAREGANEAEKGQSILDAAAPRYTRNLSLFLQVPGTPLAHWLSDAALSLFAELPALSTVGTPRCGMITGSNALFVRTWHEVSHTKSGFGIASRDAAKMSECKWFPYLKGGGFRKWVGNEESVVNWKNDGFDLRTRTDSKGHIPAHAFNDDYIFKPSVNWNKVMGNDFGVRLNRGGFMFDDGSAAIFPKIDDLDWCAGFLNSIVSSHLLHGLNPTVNIQAWDIGNLPVCEGRDVLRSKVNPLVAELTKIARVDWDNFETSWDFHDQPLLRPKLKDETLEASWRNWEAQSTAAIRRMQDLETENNRLFIAAYGLEGELGPDVPEAQITLAHADAKKDTAAFLSYAVGCMMGRYSLDAPGLILANAGDTVEDFRSKMVDCGLRMEDVSFTPDADGIIPVLDGEWFEDDIVLRTRQFLRATFGDATLNENLRFIEQSLGRELRDYFLTDFYKDHLQTYKNRPIYWLFSSGKQKAFQCLVYLHRYTPGTLARMRTEYAIPLQGKLAARITRLEEEVTQTSSSATRKKLQTDLDKSKKQMVELLAYDEQLRSYTNHPITLDLDDGVKTNYAKFGPLVAESKKVCGTKED